MLYILFRKIQENNLIVSNSIGNIIDNKGEESFSEEKEESSEQLDNFESNNNDNNNYEKLNIIKNTKDDNVTSCPRCGGVGTITRMGPCIFSVPQPCPDCKCQRFIRKVSVNF